MVRALPYPNADRLLSLYEDNDREARLGHSPRSTVAVANLTDYRALPSLAMVAAYEVNSMNLTGLGNPERLSCETVTAEYLSTLGVSPAMGRDFSRTDEAPGSPSVVILSHDFWQRRLGGHSSVLGRTILLDGRPRQIVGVMPAGFQPLGRLALASKVEFWIAAQYPPELLTNRGDHEVGALALLKPGNFPRDGEGRRFGALNASLAQQYPNTNAHIRAALSLLQNDLTRNLSDSLTTLLGASGLIVLIACVNVANLFLVRSIGRAA